jgi:saccharopepsin
MFEEITRYLSWWGGDWQDPFPDGVLGLAIGKEHIPGEFGMPTTLPSPFRSMVEQHVLDKNLFSIVFPTEEREQGSLTFGGYDEDLLDGPLVSHAIYPPNTTSWQFEIESVSIRGAYNCVPNELLMYKKTPTTKAWLMSTRPTIGFHRSLANEIYYYINGWNDGCLNYPRVPCSDVSSLPDIIIGLKGQNITLMGKDYVSRITAPDGGGRTGCYDPFDDKERCYAMIDWLGGPEGSRVAILGSPFLERVMGVWDWDARTVSCEFLRCGT